VSAPERWEPPPPEVLAAIRREADRKLSREEFEAWIKAPMSQSEEDGIRTLVAWFVRRYPTPGERLAYVRRATRRWPAGEEKGR
jgi:hypothetical protein